MKKEENN